MIGEFMLTEQQLKERQLGIGGSDTPIIMGLSSYKTPYQLYLEKTGEIKPDNEMTEAQYFGHKLEPIIREEFALKNNVAVETRGSIVHPEHTFLRGNIDGFIPEWNAVLEIKTASAFMEHELREEEPGPLLYQYLLQAAHYCIVTNADCAYIAVLIGGSRYRQFKYSREKELENKIIETAQMFWEKIQSKTPPEPINQIDLKLMFPKHDPEKTVTVEPPVLEQLTNLNETRFKIKELSQLEEKHKFNIMQFMQDAECLVDGSGNPIVSWKADKRGTRRFLLKGDK
jgi:putative phage-type endonuclease